MTLNYKDGSLPLTLGQGEKKKPKAVALALLSLQEKGEKLVFRCHELWESGEGGAG